MVRYCASVHSRAVKWSKTKGKTSVDILFTSGHQISLMMELISSPCPRIRVESIQGAGVNYVIPCLLVGGTCFTRTFPQLRSPSAARPMMYFKKTRQVIFDLPPPPIPESPTASNNSPPTSQKGCGCPGNYILVQSEAPSPWLVQAVCLPFSYYFRP